MKRLKHLGLAAGFWVMTLASLPCLGQQASPQQLRLPEGFQAELLYSVPKAQGSWVNLTTDPKGRLITSDQYGKLYRVTMQKGTSDSVAVEPINVKIGRAQGLLCAFDCLYVVAHAGDGMPAGFFRVKDTNGDDQYDQVELLRKFEGGGEHGPHAVILSPDKQSLYICSGNNTQLPDPERSRVPRVWQEDQLLPRLPDANGHNAHVLAPGGWVCKTDPDGKEFELISMGFRNEFDIAFDPNGELFTFDADMEWDFGLPWYRPTRVCHVVPGAEFGWRNGSGKWPNFYPDSLPAVIDIGPGSPTGIVFGTGAKFPAKYQHALFISDWSYGVIYAVHMEPDGSTYKATSERFCSAPALPVTDVIINPTDGAMYFLIGGRRSQSALYRVTYTGNEATAPAEFRKLNQLANARKTIENRPQDSDLSWKHFEHPDRFLRFVSRANVESAPLSTWGSKVFADENINPQSVLESTMAYIRVAGDVGAEAQNKVADKLATLNWEELSLAQRHHLIRNVGLLMMRMGSPTEKTKALAHSLAKHFPVEGNSERSEELNRELARVLIASGYGPATATTVKLLRGAEAQHQQVHFALVLSAAKAGWNTELQKDYFQWFLDAADMHGGNSFTGYLKNIRGRAIEILSPESKSELAGLLAKEPKAKDPYADLKARPFVKKWSMEELASVSNEDFSTRDLANGKKMFGVAQCYKCHRIQGQGGIAGPDLTPAGYRFSTHDLLEAIVDPSKAISDQYEATMFQMEDGTVVTGRVINLSGNRYMVQPDMIKPNDVVWLNADEIEATKPATVSVMPTGLLDNLNREEILDLLAYLKSTSPANQ